MELVFMAIGVVAAVAVAAMIVGFAVYVWKEILED